MKTSIKSQMEELMVVIDLVDSNNSSEADNDYDHMHGSPQ